MKNTVMEDERKKEDKIYTTSFILNSLVTHVLLMYNKPWKNF